MKHLAIALPKLKEIAKSDWKKYIALHPKYFVTLVYEYKKKPQKSWESCQKFNHSSSVSHNKFCDGSEKEEESKQNPTFASDFDAHSFNKNMGPPVFGFASSPKKAT